MISDHLVYEVRYDCIMIPSQQATPLVDAVDGTRDRFPSRQGLKKLENPEAVKLVKLG